MWNKSVNFEVNHVLYSCAKSMEAFFGGGCETLCGKLLKMCEVERVVVFWCFFSKKNPAFLLRLQEK